MSAWDIDMGTSAPQPSKYSNVWTYSTKILQFLKDAIFSVSPIYVDRLRLVIILESPILVVQTDRVGVQDQNF